MNTLYLLRGVSGSGKTSLAKNFLASGLVDFIFAADDYFYNEKGEYLFDSSLLNEAHQECQESTEKRLSEGYNVCVHNTFTAEWQMKHYKDLAKSYNARLVVLVVENRHGGESSHDVLYSTVVNMAAGLRKSMVLHSEDKVVIKSGNTYFTGDRFSKAQEQAKVYNAIEVAEREAFLIRVGGIDCKVCNLD